MTSVVIQAAVWMAGLKDGQRCESVAYVVEMIMIVIYAVSQPLMVICSYLQRQPPMDLGAVSLFLDPSSGTLYLLLMIHSCCLDNFAII